MEMSMSRKLLNAAAIIEFIEGAFILVLCALVVLAGINDPTLGDAITTVPSLGELAPYTVLIVGGILGLYALGSIIMGLLERRAAKDPSKIMPVWVLSIITTVFTSISVISSLVQHTPVQEMHSSIISLAISIAVLVIATNVKKEARKAQTAETTETAAIK